MKDPLPIHWDHADLSELTELCSRARVPEQLVNEPWLRISDKNRKKLEEVYEKES